MYKSTPVLSDSWRNFIPEAPDIDIQVIAGRESFISLDHLLVQGAVDINDFDSDLIEGSISPLPTHDNENPPNLIKGRYDLSKKPTQRGWQLTYDVLNTTTAFGKVDKDQHRAGFLYTSTTSEDVTDCINYYLSNGTQRSQIGTINLEVIRGHDLDFDFTYDAELDKYHITTTKYKPAELGFYWFRITWQTEGPYKVYNEYTERYEIARGRNTILSTRWRGTGSTTYRPSILYYTQKAESLYIKPTTDANLQGIYDPVTNRPYIPLNKVPNLVVTYEVWPERSGYSNYPAWTPVYKTVIDLNERLGSPWQEYGRRSES